MNSTAKKIMLIILASFVVEAFVGFVAFRIYSNMPVVDNESATSAEGIPINDDTLIIIFTHAGNDVDGNPIANATIDYKFGNKADKVITDEKGAFAISAENAEIVFSYAETFDYKASNATEKHPNRQLPL